jgi:hypothetical protein
MDSIPSYLDKLFQKVHQIEVQKLNTTPTQTSQKAEESQDSKDVEDENVLFVGPLMPQETIEKMHSRLV